MFRSFPAEIFQVFPPARQKDKLNPNKVNYITAVYGRERLIQIGKGVFVDALLSLLYNSARFLHKLGMCWNWQTSMT